MRPRQPKNARLPILVSDSGNVTEVRPVQLKNAPAPTVVSVSGSLMLVRPLHVANAHELIAFLNPFALAAVKLQPANSMSPGIAAVHAVSVCKRVASHFL